MYIKKFRIKKVNLLKIVNNYYQKTTKHQIEVTEMNQILIKITKQLQIEFFKEEEVENLDRKLLKSQLQKLKNRQNYIKNLYKK